LLDVSLCLPLPSVSLSWYALGPGSFNVRAQQQSWKPLNNAALPGRLLILGTARPQTATNLTGSASKMNAPASCRSRARGLRPDLVLPFWVACQGPGQSYQSARRRWRWHAQLRYVPRRKLQLSPLCYFLMVEALGLSLGLLRRFFHALDPRCCCSDLWQFPPRAL
jgi:hypothetical protein